MQEVTVACLVCTGASWGNIDVAEVGCTLRTVSCRTPLRDTILGQAARPAGLHLTALQIYDDCVPCVCRRTHSTVRCLLALCVACGSERGLLFAGRNPGL